VQRRLGRATCLVVSQDQVRREMLNEPDIAGAQNIDLIELVARWGLTRDLVVIVEGILNARRYEGMLQHLAGVASAAHFFAWDLELAETVKRHVQRAKRDSFSAEEMATWYHGWQPLAFVDETRLVATDTADDVASRIFRQVRGS